MKKYISFLLMFCLTTIVYGQDRSQLEKDRDKIIREIELAQATLQKTANSKQENLKALQALEEKISSRQKLLDNLAETVRYSDQVITENQIKIKSLNDEILQLKEQYKKLLKIAYINKLSSNKWTYILSAKSINKAVLRWRYTRQFQNYFEKKSTQLKALQSEITGKVELISKEKKEKENLLLNQESQIKQLAEEKASKDKLVSSLKREEKKLKTELAKATQEREKLNKAIENAIIAEMKKVESSEKIEENTALATSFAANKGKYRWPVEEGYVAKSFGKQPHPTLKGVEINNNGIDIRTSPGSMVRAIHEGKVIGVTQIPGYENMVIIQHGSFYTVYSHLAVVNLKPNQMVKSNQVIGQLSSKSGILHFEVWQKKSKTNPETWLQKR